MQPQLSRDVIGGATCIVVEERSLPVCRFVIALRHGGGYDHQHGAGATRIMLDLMLRGTQKMSRAELSGAIEELGSGICALAGQETAVLRGSCLARHLGRTLELIGDALCTPSFMNSELTALIDETVDELRAARDDDDSVADIFLRRALYGDHPFGRSANGEIPDLRRLDRDGIVATYRKRCVRDEVIVAFAGDIGPEEAHTYTERLVGRLPATAETPEPLEPPRQPAGMRILVVDKPERTQAQMRIARIGCAGADPRALPFWLGAVAFGGTFTSPFTHQIRDVRGWSYNASAGFDRRCIYPSPFVLHSAPALDDAVECLGVELDLYYQLARGELAALDDAIEMARSYLLNRYPFQIATAADLLLPALRCELLGRPVDEVLRFREDLAAVDRAAVAAAMTELLTGDDFTAVIVATADRVLDPLRDRFPDARIEVADYRDGLEL